MSGTLSRLALTAALCTMSASGWTPTPAPCIQDARSSAVSRRSALRSVLLWSLATGVGRSAEAIVEDGDVNRALEVNAAEQARRAAALAEIEKKAAQTKDAYRRELDGEAEAFNTSDLGKLLKKRTEENAAKNEASMREKYCIRDCKGLKPLAREPQTQKEFYCEECALEFGVIPGSEQYLKKSEQVTGGDAAAREEARKVEEEKKKAQAGRGIKLKAFKDRGISEL